jgi:methyl-accepting chemotaxis protein
LATAGADRSVDARGLWLVAILLAGLAATLAVAQLTWRAVTAPLDRLVEMTRMLARGDLRIRIPTEGLDREYRALAEAMMEAVQRLRETVRATQVEAAAVATAAGSIEVAAGETVAASSRMATATDALVERADRRRTEIGTSEADLGAVRQGTAELDDTAARARELGTEIQKVAGETREGIAQALDSLARAQRVIGKSGEQIAALQDSSHAVERFVDAVVGVADQTELLSLNAAIEAARAGDRGRGFAVVAAEVRKLSAHSSRAAEEVGAVVETTRQRVAEAAEAFRRGAADLGAVSTLSRDAASVLDAIDDAVRRMEEVAQVVGQTAARSREAAAALLERAAAAAAWMDAQEEAGKEAAHAAEAAGEASGRAAAAAATTAGGASRIRDLLSGFRV